MTTHIPRVTIGLPVYNGRNYLAQTMESLLAQTYTDFELVICDNASTDDTEAICRAFAARDERVRYFRNEENIGASANYNRVFELGRGMYFKWAAHDDLLAPAYLERCVEVLDQNPDVVLAYTQAKAIDGKGGIVKVYPGKHHFNSSDPRERF